MDALLGIAWTNNIPLWQFPMFCYWYATQGVGGVRGDNRVMGALMDSWLGKVLNDQRLNGDGRRSKVFAKKVSAWDIRMEMAPFEIYFYVIDRHRLFLAVRSLLIRFKRPSNLRQVSSSFPSQFALFPRQVHH
jgi:hypothetical protein